MTTSPRGLSRWLTQGARRDEDAPDRRVPQGPSAGAPRRTARARRLHVWAITRRVTKTATVSGYANCYEVDLGITGRNVELCFHPEDKLFDRGFPRLAIC